jgi:beta-glucosidase
MITFPADFLWGAATSAYQIEGGWNVDGRTPSIWDTFSHTPGKTKNGDTGDVACDHYHRWPEDVALMKEIGLKAYRFSVSWPRILPEGRGRVNQKGLDFYGRLVDALLEANIIPMPTLYHWELPQTLQDEGGWPDRRVVEPFVELADAVSRALGDRVSHWMTHNEPWCTSFLSHQIGVHAPGWQDWPAAFAAAHHVLLSHGLAAAQIRANVANAEVGIAINFEPASPASDSPADYHAARLWDGYFSRWFVDPLFGRLYPADMTDHYIRSGQLPNGLDFVQEGDMATIAAPLDFFGVNYYTRHIAQTQESLDDYRSLHNPDAEYTAMGWEVHPDSFYGLLNRLHFEYRPRKIFVTENGCSYLDEPDEQGRVADGRRIAYLQSHLQATHRAIQNGVPLAGYLQWSLLDNYEWAEGYSQRFGIVHVDYATQKRTLKDSAFWYRDLIAQNGLEI